MRPRPTPRFKFEVQHQPDKARQLTANPLSGCPQMRLVVKRSLNNPIAENFQWGVVEIK